MTTIALTCTIPGTPQQQGSKIRNAYGTMYTWCCCSTGQPPRYANKKGTTND